MQEAAGGARIHAIGALNLGNQFGCQCCSPWPVVHRVCEFVRASGAALIEQHPDHLRHLALLHAVVKDGGVAGPQSVQRAAEPVCKVDRRVASTGMIGIVGRQQNPGMHMNLAPPEFCEHRADEVQRLKCRVHVLPIDQWIRRFGNDLRERERWSRRARERNADRDRRAH